MHVHLEANEERVGAMVPVSFTNILQEERPME